MSKKLCRASRITIGTASPTLIRVSPGVRRTMRMVSASTSTPNTLKAVCPAGAPSMKGYSSMPSSCTSSRMADGWRRVWMSRRSARMVGMARVATLPL